jgi:hypothetical protein
VGGPGQASLGATAWRSRIALMPIDQREGKAELAAADRYRRCQSWIVGPWTWSAGFAFWDVMSTLTDQLSTTAHQQIMRW